eukprot:scaffold662_cov364-Pavlova_lutheri.AAC.73
MRASRSTCWADGRGAGGALRRVEGLEGRRKVGWSVWDRDACDSSLSRDSSVLPPGPLGRGVPSFPKLRTLQRHSYFASDGTGRSLPRSWKRTWEGWTLPTCANPASSKRPGGPPPPPGSD